MATVSTLPATLDFDHYRGDDFAHQFTIQEGEPLEPVDVSGRTYTAQLRRSANAEDVEATFSVDMTDAANGNVVIRLADTITEDLSGSYVWDFQQDTAGVVRTLVAGSFNIERDVTRA